MSSSLKEHTQDLMKAGRCTSPSHVQPHGGCLDRAALRRVAVAYNRRHSYDQVPVDADAAALHAELSRRFFRRCGDDELCWLESLGMPADDSLKPRAPASWRVNVDDWLTDGDIEAVMATYADHKGFRFLGIFTIDFDQKDSKGRCIGDFMCALDVRALLKSGVTSFAVVFNTDVVTGPGEHWVALYACADPANVNYGVCYYDPAGTPGGLSEVPESFHRFMRHVAKGFGAPPAPLRVCKRGHQQRNGQCGMFCIVFIAAMLHGESFDDFCRDASINDDAMRRLREVFFTSVRPGSSRGGARCGQRPPARSR